MLSKLADQHVALQIHVDLLNKTNQAAINVPPGTYKFYCSINLGLGAGHAANGMVGRSPCTDTHRPDILSRPEAGSLRMTVDQNYGVLEGTAAASGRRWIVAAKASKNALASLRWCSRMKR